MEMHTKRLVLVPLGPQFLMSTHTYASDLENTKFMVHLPNTDLSETKIFLEQVHAEWKKMKPEFYEFAILLDDEHIGAVSMHMKDNDEWELAWILQKKYWGNGYAVEAAKGIMDFAKQELNVKRFIAHCDSENICSYRVMEKLGMSFVGKTQGRRNKSSDEERKELMYLL